MLSKVLTWSKASISCSTRDTITGTWTTKSIIKNISRTRSECSEMIPFWKKRISSKELCKSIIMIGLCRRKNSRWWVLRRMLGLSKKKWLKSSTSNSISATNRQNPEFLWSSQLRAIQWKLVQGARKLNWPTIIITENHKWLGCVWPMCRMKIQSCPHFIRKTRMSCLCSWGISI